VKKLATILMFILSLNIAIAQEESMPKIQEVMITLFESYNNQDYEGMGKYYSEAMLKDFPLDVSKTLFESLMAEYGKMVELGPPLFTQPNQAIFTGHFEKGDLKIAVAINEKGEIMGFILGQADPEIPVPERNTAGLSLPFKGEWFVAWGGDTEEENYHQKFQSQKFAFDFIMVDETGKTFKNLGENNEDFYSFGKEILSPADGIVTDVINGVRDNTPGFKNPFSAMGNTVFIQHSDYEISVIAHMKQGSITVKVGDKVTGGQVIGLCGNSGNSSEPHIHYHLQNTPEIPLATGIKCYFEKMFLIKEDGNREEKTDYSPVKGDIVSPE